MKAIDFERLFAALPSPHMVLDRQLNYVAANRGYERVTGRSRQELLGRNLFELFPDEGEGGRRLRASLQKVLETGESDTIAYLLYPIPRPGDPGGSVDFRYWTAVHTPLLDDAGNVAFVVQNTVDVTDIVRAPEAAALPFRHAPGAVELVERAREAEQAYQATRAESSEFRRLFQQSPGMVAVVLGPDHVFTFANDAFIRFIGDRPVTGIPMRKALPEICDHSIFRLMDEALATAEARNGDGVRLLLQRIPEGEPQETFVDFSFHPVRGAKGETIGIFVQGIDRTESVRAAERQRSMVNELNHRVKNTLATVQSIARQSFAARSTDTAQRAFEARIKALSKVHDVLSECHWQAADLTSLLEQELASFGGDRFDLEGPEVNLKPKAAIALALIFHELVSNAVRHGALSSEGGSLSVAWEKPAGRPSGTLAFRWGESGGPPVETPQRRGFGIRMLERIIVGELDGRLDVAYVPEGLICHFEVPMTEVAYDNNSSST